MKHPPQVQTRAASHLGSADKVLVILAELSASAEPLSLAELSRRTSLPKSTVHRMLAVLRAHKVAVRMDNRYLSVVNGPQHPVPRHTASRFLQLLHNESTPYLVDLHNATGATASASVLIDGKVHHVNQVYGHRGLRITTSACLHAVVQRVLHAYGAASVPPDVLERDFVELLRTGIAHSVDVPNDVAAIAVPLRDNHALFQPVAALSVCARMSQQDPVRVAELLRRSAYDLARTIRRLHATISAEVVHSRHAAEAS